MAQRRVKLVVLGQVVLRERRGQLPAREPLEDLVLLVHAERVVHDSELQNVLRLHLVPCSKDL